MTQYFIYWDDYPERKKRLIEMMEADEKDGLYEPKTEQ